jgi:heterodisulfide reductase subunit A
LPTFMMDGKEFEADESRTVLDIARENGIDIPTLCHHRSLGPYGACRICVVEIIWGRRSRLFTACTYPAWDGMTVHTNSDKVLRARRLIFELLLTQAPASEEIKEMAAKYGVTESRFKAMRKGVDNKCILCGLCNRICQDVLGVAAIGFKGRGDKRDIATPFDKFSEVCTTCGSCATVCPTGAITLETISEHAYKPIASEFDMGLVSRPCVYIPFPQAVPNKPVIDRQNCMYFKKGTCKICETVCPADAIDYSQEDEIIEEDVGAIVVSTGFDIMPKETIEEYNYGDSKDVITGLQFERLLSASGPTSGEVRRPSDGKIPKEVVFVQCAGSREPERYMPYCSKICCMYTAKHAMLYKHRVHDGQPYIFYIDIRSGGKGYEEFVQRATDEDGVIYFRGKVSKIFQEGDKVVVWGADTLTGKKIEIYADMVVLATAILPSLGAQDLAKKLKIGTDEHGFLTEAHPKLRPVESLTSGVFLAGAAQAPKDIPETVAQASGAASKVVALFSKDELEHEPTVSEVDEELCAGCGYCVEACAYDAIELDTKRKVARVNEVLCEGCGGCAAACPSGAIGHRNFRRKQVLDMVLVATEDF